MRSLALLLLLLSTIPPCISQDTLDLSQPKVVDNAQNLTYEGVYQSGIETYLGIQYGRDTSGQNRFKPPQAYVYQAGSIVRAHFNGPACPQPLKAHLSPIYPSNITEISEDCLLLNVKRPNGTTSSSQLPVMVYIHGGKLTAHSGSSLLVSSKDELTTQPSGLILESVANGDPVMHVAMNYRLGSFGFAQSDTLHQAGSENAGLRDQRLALEWVQNNIVTFGGNPNNITIFGQSSGGLAVGMQIMAFGGTRPVPFQQGICESQALEAGITGNFTRAAMSRLVDATGCNSTTLDSAATIACLRGLSTQQLLDAQTETYSDELAANVGDIWLPAVDGDFLPDAPSNLVAQGKFANVNVMIGWCDGDSNIITPTSIVTAQDSDQTLRDFLPGFNDTSITTLEALYPVSDFQANSAANLTAEFYRTSRMMRDIIFVCSAKYYAHAISAKGNVAYLYDQNQTFLNPALTSIGVPDLGVVHTSEFAYVFGNLSHYDIDDFPFQPNQSDYDLLQRESRSWSTFAATGQPSLAGKNTLQGWTPAFARSDEVDIFVIGGSKEGLSAQAGGVNVVLSDQKLEERCAFLNSPDIIRQLNY